MKEDLPVGDKAVDELVSQAEAARVDQAAAAIATAHRLSKAAADQQDAARVAKAGADVDAAGNVSMSDDDFEDDDDPLNLQKQYLEGCPRPELKKTRNRSGIEFERKCQKTDPREKPTGPLHQTRCPGWLHQPNVPENYFPNVPENVPLQ